MRLQDELHEILYDLRDEKFKIFSQKLISQPEILGVKTPILKKIAKDLARRVKSEDLVKFKPFFHEEFAVKGYLIMLLKDDEAKFQLASYFVKSMSNWAICDQFAKIKFKDVKFANLLLKQCRGSDLEYEKRFYYVFFMSGFLDESELDGFLRDCLNEKDDRYYVKMAMAWVIAEIFIKFRQSALRLLETKKLDKFVQNKTISKIRDSFRVEKCVKDELLGLKI
ncbi:MULTISPECIES: DNA alkylation repair protein [Campylobacter]|jgi:hypothetical protein|uniref:DNA alkylation repair protein n=1 Tax=Campylobacter TaxID=194 RepID=UPI00027A3620|nr:MULTISPECIES: DNA alkylation repair protein [Campylobacter]EJP76261.1 DNA alkylation repair enzyme [Campylobacter sp. FOBRC14]